MSRMLVVLCALTLAGCGAAKIDPRTYAHANYQSADDEYRACINDDLKNVEKCEEKRVQMEANWRTYNDGVAGIKQRTDTAAVTQGAAASGIAQSADTTSNLSAAPSANTADTTSSLIAASSANTTDATGSLIAALSANTTDIADPSANVASATNNVIAASANSATSARNRHRRSP
jgi:hypothetical protein